MQLKDALKIVAEALGKDEGLPSHVRIRDGRISADGGVLAVNCPVMALFDAVVPGRELADVLDAAPDNPSVAVVDDRLVVKSGRFKADIATLPSADFPMIELPADGRNLPDVAGVTKACRTIGKMIKSDNPAPWMSALILNKNKAYAIGAEAKIVCSMPLVEDHGFALLPEAAVHYIANRADDPIRARATNSTVSFEWSDDSWMYTRQVAGTLPAQVVKLLASAKQDGWKIDDAWRLSIARLAKLSADNKLTLAPDMMKVSGRKAFVEDGSSAPLPKGVAETPWILDVLQTVLEHAEWIDLGAWPKPVAFGNSEGLIGVLGTRS
jgi:hypothetical protein